MIDFNSLCNINTEGCQKVAALLRDRNFDDIMIITHVNPDGDAVGSSCALWHILSQMGKRAAVNNIDKFPDTFSYITKDCVKEDFEYKHIITVDLASDTLLYDGFDDYGKIAAVIDHHNANNLVCDIKAVDPKAAACGEQIFDLAAILDIPFDSYLSLCLYTAISTDTGCFKFSNTTPATFMRAAVLTDKIDSSLLRHVNSVLFEKKSKALMSLEAQAVSEMEYRFDGKVSLVCVTLDMMERHGVKAGGLGGIEQLSRTPEGVVVGITLKEKSEGVFKVSLRSGEGVDSSYICSLFGGGGHRAAAGCTVMGTAQEVKNKLLTAIEENKLI